MTSYVALARAALAKRQTPGRRLEGTKANEDGYCAKGAESAKSTAPLRAAIEASPDLRLLLGLDPPPPPATTCRYCGGGATATHPLLTYLDGHADHGGFCPPPRRKRGHAA